MNASSASPAADLLVPVFDASSSISSALFTFSPYKGFSGGFPFAQPKGNPAFPQQRLAANPYSIKGISSPFPGALLRLSSGRHDAHILHVVIGRTWTRLYRFDHRVTSSLNEFNVTSIINIWHVGEQHLTGE
ncbi:unannotated protein [freshwater metagenome]|uniref:Unannotated protein n=1 Tax=freshwater metagenome TaxID=449393 RepID=A0A6J6VZJ6_9ZZZZ